LPVCHATELIFGQFNIRYSGSRWGSSSGERLWGIFYIQNIYIITVDVTSEKRDRRFRVDVSAWGLSRSTVDHKFLEMER